MSENESQGTMAAAPAPEACAECGKPLSAADRVASGDRVFCRSCYAALRSELEHAVVDMSSDINYVNATVGAVLGGVIGAAAWCGFTLLTGFAFGLVAVGIGFLVGFGTVRFAGGKRSRGLQALAVVVSVTSFVVATYFVNLTLVNRALAADGQTFRVVFPPESFDLFTRVVTVDFGLMDFVFLAIVIYQAWQIPRPIALPPAAS